MNGADPLAVLLDDVRFDMLSEGARTPAEAGRAHRPPELLAAGGDLSGTFAGALRTIVVPQLRGLTERLEAPGARWLDLAAGSAGLALALAGLWPRLQVVATDASAHAVGQARARVLEAGLSLRVVVREQAPADLQDVAAYDAVFTALEGDLPVVAIREALRPGGWLIRALANPGTDAMVASLAGLRTVLLGGALALAEAQEAVLEAAGFTEVRTLPGPSGAIVALVVARRPER